MRKWTRYAGRTMVVAAGLTAFGAGLGSANADTRAALPEPDALGGMIGSLGTPGAQGQQNGSGLPVLEGLGAQDGLNQQGGMFNQPPSKINYNNDSRARTVPGDPGPVGGVAETIQAALLQELNNQTQQHLQDQQPGQDQQAAPDEQAAPEQQGAQNQQAAPQQQNAQHQQGQHQQGAPNQQQPGQQGQQQPGQQGLQPPNTGLPVNVGKNTPLFP